MIMMMRSVCLTTPRRHVKKNGKPHRGTVYTDQEKKRTLKSGSVAIMSSHAYDLLNFCNCMDHFLLCNHNSLTNRKCEYSIVYL